MRNANLILFLLLVFCGVTFGQQEPQYTQFMYNKLPINSAYAGGRDVLTIRALYRNQWVKLEGHPQTATFSIHSPLKNEDLALGLNIVHDRLGVTEQTWITGAYAYRIPFGTKQNLRLAFGVNAGMLIYTSALSTVQVNEEGDLVFAENVKRIMPDVGGGMYLDGDNFYVGLSIPNFIGADLANKDRSEDEMMVEGVGIARRLPHIMAMAGGVIPLGASLKLRPQGLFKHVIGKDYESPFSIDFNLSLMILDRLNIGGTYRTTFGNKPLENQSSVDGMIEVWPTNQLMIGYAYGYDLTKLNDVNKGSHEVTLGFDFKFKKDVMLTPRYF